MIVNSNAVVFVFKHEEGKFAQGWHMTLWQRSHTKEYGCQASNLIILSSLCVPGHLGRQPSFVGLLSRRNKQTSPDTTTAETDNPPTSCTSNETSTNPPRQGLSLTGLY